VQLALDLMVACLRAHGARRVFGDSFGDLAVEPTSEPALAALLADAQGRHFGVGVAYSSADQTLRLSSRTDGSSPMRPDSPVRRDSPARRDSPVRPVDAVCESPLHIVRVVEAAARDVARNHTTHVVHLAFDLATPIPSAARPVGHRDYVPYAGELVRDATRFAVLAGPYLVRRGAAAAVRDFAARTNCGVANTWGAKGLFTWDSPHHMGTVGLQARDFELVFDQIDTVLATGIDPDEARPTMPAGINVITVDPQQLSSLATHITPRSTIHPNALYAALSAVAQPGYVDNRFPYHPARVVATLREQLPSGGVVAADPGRAGLWVARTFPTTELGSVVVPATGAPGTAAAIAACAALDGRSAIAVVGERSAMHSEVLDWIAQRGNAVIESVWDSPASPIDWSLDDQLVAAAGEVVAFG
jgi:thiamine pyrophosphate-dependent acetolactate synthase large subunit-like protein